MLTQNSSSEDVHIDSVVAWPNFAYYIILGFLSSFLTVLGMVMLSLDEPRLREFQEGTSDMERRFAFKILPIFRRGHLTIFASFTIMNCILLELAGFFLGRFSSKPFITIPISFTFSLAFYQFIPQVLAVRYGIKMLSKFVWLVNILTWPYWVYPFVWLLKKCIGDHGPFYRVAHLRAFISVMSESKKEDNKAGDRLGEEDALILKNFIDSSDVPARDMATPFEKLRMVPFNCVLNAKNVRSLTNWHFSRVPVFDGIHQNIVGILMVKELLTLDISANFTIRDATMAQKLRLRPALVFPADTKPLEILRGMRKGISHIAFLKSKTADGTFQIVGFITFCSLVEMMFGTPIWDEQSSRREDIAEQSTLSSSSNQDSETRRRHV